MSTSTSIGTASYADCVTALRGSLSHLETSVDTLGNGVSDFPRLLNVLKTIRHYELIPQPTLAAAESSLRDEIGPAITVLLDRADTQIDRVERRIESLKARSDLQQGRLSQASGDYEATHDAKGKGNKAAGQKLSGEARLRAKALRQRKEALKYSVERLELEVLQKERELKKQVDKA